MQFCFTIRAATIILIAAIINVVAQYTADLPYQKISAEIVNGTAVFDGGATDAQPGQPSLPTYKVSFLLPPDADLKSVKATIDGCTEKTFTGTCMVNPVEMLPSESADRYPTVIEGLDTTMYRKDAYYPAEYIGKTSCGSMQNYKMVTVTVHAFRYNPVQKKLRMLSGGRLIISFNSCASASDTTMRSAATENILKMKVINPSVFEKYGILFESTKSTPVSNAGIKNAPLNLATPTKVRPPASIPDHKYLVLTTDYIKNNSPALSTFLHNVVEENGGTSSILTVEGMGWDSYKGQERADTIRNYLRRVWQEEKISNLLIIGSPDCDSGDIPMKRHGYFVTDFYYTDMDSLVNGTGDIAVGRIPAVYDTPTVRWGTVPFNIGEINDILTRTMNYCLTGGDAAEWRRLVMLPIVPLGRVVFSDNYLDFGENTIINRINMNTTGWEFYRLYDPFDWNYVYAFLNGVTEMNPLPEVPYCNQYVVPQKWNELSPGLVVYNTHGFATHANSILGNDDRGYYNDPITSELVRYPGSVTYLDPTYPAVVFAASCHTAPEEMGLSRIHPTGRFVDHLGYQTLLHNAVAYIGASRDIEQGPNKMVSEGFVDYMTRCSTNCTVGEALNLAKSGEEPGTFLFNLWGCPNVSFNLNDFGLNIKKPDNLRTVADTLGDPAKGAIISWNAVTPATSYVIERGDASASRTGGFSFLTEVTTTSYTDITLSSGTKYKYRVYAKYNSERGPYSSIDSVATYTDFGSGIESPVPQTPNGLNGVNGMNSGTLITWSPNTSGPGVISYNVKRSKSASGPFVTVGTVASTSSAEFADTNLNNGKQYWYCISAVNEFGESDNSTPPILISPSSPGDGNVSGCVQFNSYPYGAPKVCGISFDWEPTGFNYLGSMIEYREMMPDSSFATPNGDVWLPEWAKFIISDRQQRGDNMPAGRRYYCDSWEIASKRRAILGPNVRGNVNYQFRIRNFTHPSDSCIDEYDYSAPEIRECRTNNDPTIFDPIAPVIISGNQVGPEVIELAWNYSPSILDTNEVSYRIYFKDKNNQWRTQNAYSSPQTVLIGCNTTTTLYIRACYENGDTEIDGNYSVPFSVTTDYGVGVPTLSLSSTYYNTSVSVNIDKHSVLGITYIERKIGPTGTWIQCAAVPDSENGYFDTNVENGLTYYYRARNFCPSNPIGLQYSTWSAIDSIMVPLKPSQTVMGFEDANQWNITVGSGTLSDNNSHVTERNTSMQVQGNGWQKLTSVQLRTYEINSTSSNLKVDIFVGTTQPNPYWIGQMQLVINCPSANIYECFVGQVDLTNLERGTFNTVSFNLPGDVMAALAELYYDFTFSITLNTNPGSGPYYIDNMRF